MQAIGMTPTAAHETTAADLRQHRLVEAAHEFEAQMMKELLGPMTGQDALTSGDDDTVSGAGATGALGEFASEALGQALSRQGGFGIADCIVRELSRSGNQSGSGKVTGSSHGDTGISPIQ